MEANFKDLQVQTTLNGAPETADLRPYVAEAVYQNASTFEQHQLAHKIIDTDGPIELSDQDVSSIKNAIRGYKFFIQKPILEALGENFE